MRNEEKLTYAQPKLCTYGGFAELTAAGSSGTSEAGNSGASMIRV